MKNEHGQAWLLIIGVVGILVLLFLGMWYLGKRIGSGRLLLTPPSSPPAVSTTPEPARVLSPAPTPPPPPSDLPSTGPDPNATAPPGYYD